MRVPARVWCVRVPTPGACLRAPSACARRRPWRDGPCPQVYYPVRHHLVQHMVSAMQRLGFTPSVTIEQRRLAVDLSEVVIKWELQRIKDQQVGRQRLPPAFPAPLPGARAAESSAGASLSARFRHGPELEWRRRHLRLVFHQERAVGGLRAGGEALQDGHGRHQRGESAGAAHQRFIHPDSECGPGASTTPHQAAPPLPGPGSLSGVARAPFLLCDSFARPSAGGALVFNTGAAARPRF